MVGHHRPDGRSKYARSPLLAVVALVAGTIGFSGSSAADASLVGGGAFGASVDVRPVGGTPTTVEPSPAVMLPADGGRVGGSAPALSAGGADPFVGFGGRLLETGPLSVASEGTTGPSGAAASRASVERVEALDSLLVATELASTCTSTEAGATGVAVLTDARLRLSEGQAVALPGEPPPNTVIGGALGSSNDTFTVVLNEQEVVDGALVVNAVRIVLEGPSVVGEVIVAQSRCGTTAPAPPPLAPDAPLTGPAAAPPAAAASAPLTGPAAEPSMGPASAPPAEPAAEPSVGPAARLSAEPERRASLLAPDDPAGAVSAASATDPGSPQPRVGGGPVEQTPSATGGAEVLAAGLPAVEAQLLAAQVSEVSGGAFGHFAEVSLFGNQQPPSGPAPQVTLPSSGGDETATAPSAEARFGPAVLFESGALAVSTRGMTGPDGSVTSSASAREVGPGPFTAGEVSSTCTAAGDGVTGSTTIANGVLEGTSTGTVQVPPDPAPGTTYEGVVEGANDNYRMVFNEQVVDGDAITVNAVHLYLLGPTAVGDLIIGQSRCGVGSGGTSGVPATGGTGGTARTGGRSGTGGTGDTSATGGTGGTGGTSATGRTSGRPGQSGGRLADTGGEIRTLLAVVLVLAAFTTRRWAHPRPVAEPDGRP